MCLFLKTGGIGPQGFGYTYVVIRNRLVNFLKPKNQLYITYIESCMACVSRCGHRNQALTSVQSPVVLYHGAVVVRGVLGPGEGISGHYQLRRSRLPVDALPAA